MIGANTSDTRSQYYGSGLGLHSKFAEGLCAHGVVHHMIDGRTSW